jgi:hypothetical protein
VRSLTLREPPSCCRTPNRAVSLLHTLYPILSTRYPILIRKTPRESPPKLQPSRGSQSVRCRAGDPTPSGPQLKQVLLRCDSLESLALVSQPDHRLTSRSVGGRPLGPPWQISRFAVVVARSTIPEGIPVRCFDRTFRLQFPADFRLTFLPASRRSGPTGPAVTRRVGRRRRVSPSTWREK